MQPTEPRLSEITLIQGSTALGIALILLLFLIGSRKIVGARLKRCAFKSFVNDLVLELIDASRLYFFVAVSVYAGSSFLPLPFRATLFIEKAAILISIFQFGGWTSVGINFWIEKYLRKKAASDVASATTIGLISFVSKTLLFLLIALLVLNNLGVNITALVAGLGVGGIAVALALQNILGDLFASLTIVLDKPFAVGDFIIVGDFMGSIEHIGLKTTRIRSLSGEQLIFSNSDLLQSRIRNFKRMYERRVSFVLGVTYQTPSDKLRMIPSIVKEIVEACSGTRFDRCHFLKFGESSLDFEIVYWVLSPEFNVYADTAQAINIKIFEHFAQREINFAYPTRTLFVEKEDHSRGSNVGSDV